MFAAIAIRSDEKSANLIMSVSSIADIKILAPEPTPNMNAQSPFLSPSALPCLQKQTEAMRFQAIPKVQSAVLYLTNTLFHTANQEAPCKQ